MGTATIGAALPAIQAGEVSETGFRPLAPTTLLPIRLDDQRLTELAIIAESPLPALLPCDGEEFTKLIMTMGTMARRADDETTGKLRLAILRRVIGQYPREAIAYMVETAITTLEWFPSPKQCLDILAGWKRNDEAVQAKASAVASVRAERLARFDDVMSALERREVDQAGIDALPERVRAIGMERGFLRLHDDGVYRARPLPAAEEARSA